MTKGIKKGKMTVVAVFQIEVQMPQGLKQKEWEKRIHDNLMYPTSLGSTDFDNPKVKLIGKKVRYE